MGEILVLGAMKRITLLTHFGSPPLYQIYNRVPELECPGMKEKVGKLINA